MLKRYQRAISDVINLLSISGRTMSRLSVLVPILAHDVNVGDSQKRKRIFFSTLFFKFIIWKYGDSIC